MAQICEEDAVIQQLRESRTEDEQYFDVHFGGLPAALYKDEEDVPPYDANMEEPIVWLRPGELCRDRSTSWTEPLVSLDAWSKVGMETAGCSARWQLYGATLNT